MPSSYRIIPTSSRRRKNRLPRTRQQPLHITSPRHLFRRYDKWHSGAEFILPRAFSNVVDANAGIGARSVNFCAKVKKPLSSGRVPRALDQAEIVQWDRGCRLARLRTLTIRGAATASGKSILLPKCSDPVVPFQRIAEYDARENRVENRPRCFLGFTSSAAELFGIGQWL